MPAEEDGPTPSSFSVALSIGAIYPTPPEGVRYVPAGLAFVCTVGRAGRSSLGGTGGAVYVSARGLCCGDVLSDVRLKAFEKDDLMREDPEADVGEPSDGVSDGRLCIAGFPNAFPRRAVKDVLRWRSAVASDDEPIPVPEALRT